MAIRPPAPSVSSSGWGAITTVRLLGKSHCGVLRSEASHSASEVTGVIAILCKSKNPYQILLCNQVANVSVHLLPSDWITTCLVGNSLAFAKETVMNDDDKKCAHPSCTCKADKDSKY